MEGQGGRERRGGESSLELEVIFLVVDLLLVCMHMSVLMNMSI